LRCVFDCILLLFYKIISIDWQVHFLLSENVRPLCRVRQNVDVLLSGRQTRRRRWCFICLHVTVKYNLWVYLSLNCTNMLPEDRRLILIVNKQSPVSWHFKCCNSWPLSLLSPMNLSWNLALVCQILQCLISKLVNGIYHFVGLRPKKYIWRLQYAQKYLLLKLNYVHCTLTEVFINLTEIFPRFFLSCKTNARAKLAKTGHDPHSFTLFVICVVRLLFVLFSVLFTATGWQPNCS